MNTEIIAESSDNLPEEKLLLAVLVQAIHDLVWAEEGIDISKDKRQEAFAWIMDDDYGGITSFKEICQHFNICPNKIRRMIFTEMDKQRFKKINRRVLGVSKTV